MAADELPPCIAKSSTDMILNMQYDKMIKDANIIHVSEIEIGTAGVKILSVLMEVWRVDVKSAALNAISKTSSFWDKSSRDSIQ